MVAVVDYFITHFLKNCSHYNDYKCSLLFIIILIVIVVILGMEDGSILHEGDRVSCASSLFPTPSQCASALEDLNSRLSHQEHLLL